MEAPQVPQLAQPDIAIGSNDYDCDAVSDSATSFGTGVSSLCKRTTQLEAAGFLEPEFTETAQRDGLMERALRDGPSQGKSQRPQIQPQTFLRSSAVSQRYKAHRRRIDALNAPSDAVDAVKQVLSRRRMVHPLSNISMDPLYVHLAGMYIPLVIYLWTPYMYIPPVCTSPR